MEASPFWVSLPATVLWGWFYLRTLYTVNVNVVKIRSFNICYMSLKALPSALKKRNKEAIQSFPIPALWLTGLRWVGWHLSAVYLVYQKEIFWINGMNYYQESSSQDNDKNNKNINCHEARCDNDQNLVRRSGRARKRHGGWSNTDFCVIPASVTSSCCACLHPRSLSPSASGYKRGQSHSILKEPCCS